MQDPIRRASCDQVLRGFDAALDIVAEHRAWAEAQGRLADPVVNALLSAGAARLYLPESLGGLQVDPITCAAVTERIARVDSAAAWFVMVANSAKLAAANWPLELVEYLFGDDPDVIVAASGNRPFIAEPKGDGFVVDGVNSFVSGCHHARWLLSPALVGDEVRMIVLAMAECEIMDNWHALGMRGTGSNDVRATAVWIPARQVIEIAEPGRGTRNAHYQGTLY